MLPPYLPGMPPTSYNGMSPYSVSLLEVVKRYAINPDRLKILKGLISYRDDLRSIGIIEGFQWLDGSFVEDCEQTRGRPPADVDLITFSPRPKSHSSLKDWRNLIYDREDLFDPAQTKKKYYCDAFWVDLCADPTQIVNLTKYWFGLFSHQRETALWKGMLQIPITSNDDEVKTFINEGEKNAS